LVNFKDFYLIDFFRIFVRMINGEKKRKIFIFFMESLLILTLYGEIKNLVKPLKL